MFSVLTHAAAPGVRTGAKGHNCEGSVSIACLIAKKENENANFEKANQAQITNTTRNLTTYITIIFIFAKSVVIDMPSSSSSLASS